MSTFASIFATLARRLRTLSRPSPRPGPNPWAPREWQPLGAAPLWLLRARADTQSGRSREAEQMLSGAAPAVWIDLDSAVRREWPRVSGTGAPDPHALDALDNLGLVMASFHPSGLVREQAVIRIAARVPDALALPALALRGVDWVPQVRDRAHSAVRARMGSVEALTTLSVFAARLSRRANGDWLHAQINEAIANLGPSDLRQVLSASDVRVRRTAYVAMLKASLLSTADLLSAAASDQDHAIRTGCATQAIERAVDVGAGDVLQRLSRNRTTQIRAAAIAASADADDISAARTALDDRAPLVRGVAQAILRRAGHDPAESYRNAVSAKRSPDPSAIAGLGESGSAADCDTIRPWLAHEAPRGRSAAIRALLRLGSSDMPAMLRMLSDPSPSVVRSAASALMPSVGDLDVGVLLRLAQADEQWATRISAIRLLRGRGKWERVLVDLDLYDDAEPRIRRLAQADLVEWIVRDAPTAYKPPVGVIADLIEARLLLRRDALGADRARMLRFHIRTTG